MLEILSEFLRSPEPITSEDVIVFVVVAILTLWDVTWRAFALWKAARNGHMKWFVTLLVISSLGILPIIYIKFFQKKSGGVSKQEEKTQLENNNQ